MTFETWWDNIHNDLMTDRQIAKAAWEAATVRNCECSHEDACRLLYAAPEGYVLLPVEPTEKIEKAIQIAINCGCYPEGIYRDVIQAAQEEE